MKEDLHHTWRELGKEAQSLLLILASTPSNIGEQHLRVLCPAARFPKDLEELLQRGLIEQTSYIKEQQHICEVLAPLSERALSNDGHELTEMEALYLEARTNVAEFHKAPAIYKGWTEPKYRIVDEIREYVLQQSA